MVESVTSSGRCAIALAHAAAAVVAVTCGSSTQIGSECEGMIESEERRIGEYREENRSEARRADLKRER
jgi:hypothetical protein